LSALTTGQVAPVESDDRLVAATRCGDDRAFGELYSRYGRRIVSYIFGMLGDHARAEDIGQEVFISALRRMRATERPIAFKPWIYEIARNACIDEFRRTRRAREVPLDIDEESKGPERQLESPTASPDAALERRQQLDDLRGAFRGLSESHHKIIVLREMEGLSYTEIGRRMGMSRPVVESTLFRARRRLGTEYQEIASGRRCEQLQAVIDAGGEKAVRALGIRERRRVARHVAHCQPCRRYAHLAGVDDSVLKGPGLVEKIAALLPIPAFLRARRRGADDEAASASGHSGGLLQSMPTLARFVDPASPVLGLGRATAAIIVAAVVAGGGVAGTLATVGGARPHGKPAVAVAHVSSGPGRGSSASSGRAQIGTSSRTGSVPAKAARGASGGGSGGVGKSQASSTQSTSATSSSATSNTSAATPAHGGAAAGSSTQTTNTSNGSQTSAAQSSPAQAPASSQPPAQVPSGQSGSTLPQLPSGQSGSTLPQLPSGQSGSTLPSPPPVTTPQLPQPPNLNLPSTPSAGNLTDTTHNLVH
jgi:RNA polymerase sigma factor (sigma-70 family)